MSWNLIQKQNKKKKLDLIQCVRLVVAIMKFHVNQSNPTRRVYYLKFK